MARNVQIFSSFDQSVFRRKHFLRDVRPARVRRQLAVKIVGFLHCGLSLAREKPVDEDTRGVGMWSVFDKADRTTAGAQRLSFLPVPRMKIFHRQSLTGGLFTLPTAMADGKFSHRQPIGDRAPIAESHVHGAKGSTNKLRPEFRMIVIKL